MDDMLEILKYLGPFLGVFLGWFLTRKSEKDRVKYDERKSIKKAVFSLLEIRNRLMRGIKTEKFLQVYTERVNLRLNENEKVDFAREKEKMKLIINRINNSERLPNIVEKFDECIVELSVIDPVLAYKLNGKQNISQYIETWENEILNLYNTNDVIEQINTFKPKIINGIKNDFDEIIMQVVELTDDVKLISETNKLIQEPSDIEYEYDIDEFIDNIIENE